MSSYYDEKYFVDYQKNIGEFGGLANLFKFEAFISEESRVLDFGCGGGYLLKNLRCQGKYGFEINPVAAQEARKFGLEVFQDWHFVPKNLDVIISNHALEHVDFPLLELQRAWTALRSGGLAVFATPYENKDQAWDPKDVNKHLHTWSPLNLGNLFTRAGFEVLEALPLHHTWPPNYLEIVQHQGWEAFHAACAQYSAQTGIKQVRVVARRP
jgi:SAM-dependent methyltransferase